MARSARSAKRKEEKWLVGADDGRTPASRPAAVAERYRHPGHQRVRMLHFGGANNARIERKRAERRSPEGSGDFLQETPTKYFLYGSVTLAA